MEELGLAYTKINVAKDRNDALRREIAEKSGVLTVPVLEIEGKFVGDSGKIIAFLNTRFARAKL